MSQRDYMIYVKRDNYKPIWNLHNDLTGEIIPFNNNNDAATRCQQLKRQYKEQEEKKIKAYEDNECYR